MKSLLSRKYIVDNIGRTLAGVAAISCMSLAWAVHPLDAAVGTGRVVEDNAESDMLRGGFMANNGNAYGAFSQFGHALKQLPEGEQREYAVWERLVASLSFPNEFGVEDVEAFISDYPASARRQQAMLLLGDVLYDNYKYGAALRVYSEVNERALNPSDALSLLYHKGFCLLKMANYAAAEPIFKRLIGTEYTNDARFYLGYISYVNGDWAEAQTWLAQVVQSSTMPAAMANYYMAQTAYMRGDYKLAATMAQESLANNVVKVEPTFRMEALRIAGESLYETGNTSKGLDLLEQYAVQCNDPRPSALYILGVADYNAGKYRSAIDRLTPVSADLDVMGQSARLFIGQSYMQLDNYNAAAMSLEKAAQPGGDRAIQEAALYNLAVARMQGGRSPFGNSAAMLEDFLQRFPDSEYAPTVADYLINGYLADDNYDAALEAISKISNPGESLLKLKQMALNSKGTNLMRRDNVRGALAAFIEASKMGQYDAKVAAESMLWAGECQYRLGDYKSAISSFGNYLRQSAADKKNSDLARYNLGYARFANKNWKESQADFSRFVKTATTAEPRMLADAYNRIADCDYYLGHYAEADRIYGEAYKMAPTLGDYSLFQQAMMRGLQRDYTGKIDQMGSFLTEFPNSPLVAMAMLETAESFNELKDHAHAVETYTALANRFPSTDQGRQAQLMLAITYLNTGNRSQAIKYYKSVIERFPSSEQARVAADDLKQIYADDGKIDQYLAFMANVPDAPTIESAELAQLMLQSAESANSGGRPTDALRFASEVIEKYPDSPEAVAALKIKAQAELTAGDADGALVTYRLLAEKSSSSTDTNIARLGVMRVSRDMSDYQTALDMARLLHDASGISASDKDEVLFTEALALRNTGQEAPAIEIWEALATRPEAEAGAKSAVYLAEYYYENGQIDKANDAVNELIEANPAHDYWLARGFILLSDILRKKGESFEADEYLRSLRENYPGSEPDIFRMIDQRLEK